VETTTSDYSTETLYRLQRTLATVHGDVADALKQARYKSKFRPAPLQSSINLHIPRLPTPSVTTIRSATLEVTETTSETANLSLQRLSSIPPESELSGFSQISLNHHSSKNTPPTSNPPEGSAENASKNKATDSSEGPSVWVNHRFPRPTSPGWLDLYVSLERSSNNASPTRTFTRASVKQEYLDDSVVVEGRNHHRLNLSTLAIGEEVVLPNLPAPDPDISSGTEMSIILTYPRMNPINLTCLWHGTANVPFEG
jgi:hypothetical protein